MFTTISIDRATPPDTYAPVSAKEGMISPLATGIAGLAAGSLLGAGWMAAKKFQSSPAKPDGEKGE